jgi:hypothetical protein
MKKLLSILLLLVAGLLCMGGCHYGCYSYDVSFGIGSGDCGIRTYGPPPCHTPRYGRYCY